MSEDIGFPEILVQVNVPFTFVGTIISASSIKIRNVKNMSERRVNVLFNFKYYANALYVRNFINMSV